jgi:hypothetical protein
MRENLTKHLEFVQAIIARMAGNSFLLKGWTVTLSAALFALAAKDSNAVFALLAIIPEVSFWGLDAYYLRQERLYRKLYDDLRLAPEGSADQVEPFSLSTSKYADQVPGWFRTLFSRSVVALHGVVIGAALVVIIVLS